MNVASKQLCQELYDPNTDNPFALEYLDYCKSIGIETLEATQDWSLVWQFGKLWKKAGGEATGLDVAIVLGMPI